jgi:hypothetical protein
MYDENSMVPIDFFELFWVILLIPIAKRFPSSIEIGTPKNPVLHLAWHTSNSNRRDGRPGVEPGSTRIRITNHHFCESKR